MHARQRGLTLLEVMLAVVVVALGLFAAAALQVQASQATDAARREVQGALAEHALDERTRAAGTLTVRQP
jgi:type IV pilus assembly protein PilV